MANMLVEETNTTNMDVLHPKLELVRFTTQGATGDYYLSKKFARILGAFASNSTSDAKEISVSWNIGGNGQPNIVIKTNEDITNGYLVIFGGK